MTGCAVILSDAELCDQVKAAIDEMERVIKTFGPRAGVNITEFKEARESYREARTILSSRNV